MIATKNNDSIFLNILFNGIKANSLPVNLNGKLYEDFKEGEIIYESGDESNFVYLIVSGKVKIKENGVKKLVYRRENEFFGEKEIIKKSNRLSSAMAETDSTLYKISKQDFESLLKNLPAVKQNIIDFANLTEDDFNSVELKPEQYVQEENTLPESNEVEINYELEPDNHNNEKDDSELPDYLKNLDDFEDITHNHEPEPAEEKAETKVEVENEIESIP
ncbi:MAG: cyclic nucleotide-binding domain-containing protein, partial [Ignavibacterium sp.]|nr:cyclic nucleotide-binding domain-containing protein [Ignavibacterium sp.]